MNLSNLTLNMYTSAGVVTHTVAISPGVLVEVGSGQGGDGYFFELTDTMGEIATFLSDDSNRMGLSFRYDRRFKRRSRVVSYCNRSSRAIKLPVFGRSWTFLRRLPI